MYSSGIIAVSEREEIKTFLSYEPVMGELKTRFCFLVLSCVSCDKGGIEEIAQRAISFPEERQGNRHLPWNHSLSFRGHFSTVKCSCLWWHGSIWAHGVHGVVWTLHNARTWLLLGYIFETGECQNSLFIFYWSILLFDDFIHVHDVFWYTFPSLISYPSLTISSPWSFPGSWPLAWFCGPFSCTKAIWDTMAWDYLLESGMVTSG